MTLASVRLQKDGHHSDSPPTSHTTDLIYLTQRRRIHGDFIHMEFFFTQRHGGHGDFIHTELLFTQSHRVHRVAARQAGVLMSFC